MADIHQWRRMIQPARVRTPAVDADDSEVIAPPGTPRRPTKPHLSASFRHRATTVPQSNVVPEHDNTFLRRTPSWTLDHCSPSVNLDELVDSMMCNLLDDPYSGVTAHFASDLMRLFEGYRIMKDDNRDLLTKLEQEMQQRITLELAWNRERQEYKAEVKRLELILSKGERGLAEVTLARQHSVLKRSKTRGPTDSSGLETILQLLERTQKYEGQTWSSEKANMRPRSPSSKMRGLSRQYTTRAPINDIHADMPSGTPPLTAGSFLDHTGNDGASCAVPLLLEPKTSMSSDDTFSSFSSFDDLFSGDAPTQRLLHGPPREKYNAGLGMRRLSSAAADRPPSAAALQKMPTLRTKASGFLSKLRPQLNIDTTMGDRFSFEAGDDTLASFTATPADTLPAAVRDRLLRKTASMSSLGMAVRKSSIQEHALSPVAQSPTTPAPGAEGTQTPTTTSDDLRRRTRIPTPVYRTGSLARPRQERDDSTSSLLTAIRRSADASRRSNSVSSSAFSSPSGSRFDLTQGVHAAEIVHSSFQRTAGGNELDDQLNNDTAVAAAKTACHDDAWCRSEGLFQSSPSLEHTQQQQ